MNVKKCKEILQNYTVHNFVNNFYKNPKNQTLN